MPSLVNKKDNKRAKLVAATASQDFFPATRGTSIGAAIDVDTKSGGPATSGANGQQLWVPTSLKEESFGVKKWHPGFSRGAATVEKSLKIADRAWCVHMQGFEDVDPLNDYTLV